MVGIFSPSIKNMLFLLPCHSKGIFYCFYSYKRQKEITFKTKFSMENHLTVYMEENKDFYKYVVSFISATNECWKCNSVKLILKKIRVDKICSTSTSMRLHSRKIFLTYNPNTFKDGKNAVWKTILMELNCSAICGKQTYFNELLLSVAKFFSKKVISIK